MRRILLVLLALSALALPAAAFAALDHSSGDGTLVVRNADNGDGSGLDARPVVTLVIHGSVVGHVGGQGRIAIYNVDPTATSDYSVSGAVWHKDVSDIGTAWGGPDFRFRAVGGDFRVVIRGSDVDLFAIGTGTVTLTGQANTPKGDGDFSLNGNSFISIPLDTTKTIGTAGD